jgi:sulfite reductase alpha subunit-like flavoprotein
MTEARIPISIIYGSQTGNTSDLAHWLSRKLATKSVDVECLEGNHLTNITGVDLSRFYIFMVSTAGNGDFPMNFKALFEAVRNDQISFKGARFAVFGLGDSKYPQFNYAARLIYGIMEAMGGLPQAPLGCGDDQHTLGFWQEFIPWVKGLWKRLFNEQFPEEICLPAPLYDVLEDDSPINESRTAFPWSRCLRNERITAENHEQDVRFLEFDVLQKWKYEPGDVLEVKPTCPSDRVMSFIAETLEDSPSRALRIIPTSSGAKVKGSFSLFDLFSSELDLNAIAGHYFYEVLYCSFNSQLSSLGREATEEEERVLDKLALLASFSFQGANERLRYSSNERLSVYEVLRDFHQVKVSLQRLIEAVPLISSRYYSVTNIATSSSREVAYFSNVKVPTVRAQICVGLAQYTTLLGRNRAGLCSEYLSNLKPGEITNRVRINRGFSTKLKQSLEKSNSLILIGPGTGLSPLVPIIQSYKETKKILVVTGFRHFDTDFLFREQLANHFGDGNVTALVAWSRPSEMDRGLDFCWNKFSAAEETGNGCRKGRKTWVQDLIQVQASLFMDSIHDRTTLVISGRSHPMPDQIITELKQLVGKEVIDQMARSGRIVYDTWG